MLTLKELRLKGIGRFVEEQTVSFDKLGNLIQVDGKNNNTGGSSGAAKSTIFNALDFLFGINSVPNSVLQSRLTEEPMFVEGDFDLDGQSLTISRGKKLKIELNGEVTTGSAKLSEEKLDQILSIPRPLFRPMLHKKQGEKGFFLNFTPKETNDFLTDCLGLGHLKKHLVNLDTKLLELSKKKETLHVSVESAKASLSASQMAFAGLGSLPNKEVDQETILRLKAKHDASVQQFEALMKTLQLESQTLESERPSIITISFDTTKRRDLEKELTATKEAATQLILQEKDKQNKNRLDIQKAQSRADEFGRKIQSGIVAKEEALKIAGEIKKLRDSLCPTCEQTWVTDSAKVKEAQLIEKLNVHKEAILCGERAILQKEAVEQEINYLELYEFQANPPGYVELSEKEAVLKNLISQENTKEMAHNETHNRENKIKQDDFDKKRKALIERHMLAQTAAWDQRELDRRVLDTAVSKLKSYEENRIRHENSLKNLSAQIASHTERVGILQKEYNAASETHGLSEELKRAIKSYLSCSFDEALDSIGESATRLVRNIPNMANATIQLMGVRETKEGKIKEEVNALLHLDGDENIDIRSLSGGERASIDLAIDLSVIDLIESKTNKGINVFILDEPFTGLDSQNIEMALEMLKSANLDKKLIVVDHNPIVKEQISDRITVIRNGDTSVIEGR